MTTATREQYETLALERLAELARSANERIALEAARTLLVHLRLSSPQRHGDTENASDLGGDLARAGALAQVLSAAGSVAEDGNGDSRGDNPSLCLGASVVDEDVERAREHVLRAMDRCAGLLDHENPFVVLRAAREILQHYRHLCRERFRWVTWSEVKERRAEVRAEREKKARSAAACAQVAALGGQLAGIREAWDREEDAAQDGPSGPHEWQEQLPELRQEGGVPPVCQGGQKPSFDEDDWDLDPPDPDGRAPP